MGYTAKWAFGLVSIHALLAECDGHVPRNNKTIERFQSTHSLRSATYKTQQAKDLYLSFNPRTPCGVRPCESSHCNHATGFNPRTPCGVRHDIFRGTGDGTKVSIHALLAECDRTMHGQTLATGSFNPRTPCGVRPAEAAPVAAPVKFQSTHSLRSATLRPPHL